MPSATYDTILKAMRERKQVFCTYETYHREMCPAVLGHSDGVEKVLAFQFGGRSSGNLPPGGSWKCLFVEKITGIDLVEGRWHAGKGHQSSQTCVKDVDYDVNPESPFNPRFRL